MKRRAFTLIELLTVIAIVGVLAAILFAVVGQVRASAQRAQCAANLRQLSGAVLLFANDHCGELPRSNHSAFAHRTRSWLTTVQPYLGDGELKGAALAEALERYCRCPSEEGRASGSSYGLNVFFELDPAVDDYAGAPASWRRLYQIPDPSRTILLAELTPNYQADHIMSHFWEGDVSGAEVALERHQHEPFYAFADGHVEALAVDQVFDVAQGVNRWNPVLSGQR